ncbi:MAG: N-acetyltransferase [Gemmatimonadetes bacterium]|nr:N-acetyltransferase [Gemmatimonadota bacterium]
MKGIDAPGALVVRPIESRRDLSRFVGVPWAVYDPNEYPQWVPPLRVQVRGLLDGTNPIWKRMARQLFLAERGGKPIGRIAAIENPAHNEFHGDRIGFFGFFECREDSEAAAALVTAAADWIRDRGLDRIRGPVSPSTNHECGVLVKGFGRHPLFLTPWNPPYYGELLEAAGLEGVKDLLAYPIPLGSDFQLPDSFFEQAERARRASGLTFRDLDLSDADTELERIWEVYHSAWEPNWGFVPMSKEEFFHLGRELKPLLIPRFAFLAEVGGEPAGFLLIVPDFNRILKEIPDGRLFPLGIVKLLLGKRRLRTGRLMALGIRKEFRTRGIFALFAAEAFRRGREYGAVMAEASWILEDNEAMRRPLERLGLSPYRRWRIYQGRTAPILAAAS